MKRGNDEQEEIVDDSKGETLCSQKGFVRMVPVCVEAMAACAKCTLAVPAKWVSEEGGDEVSLPVVVVVAVEGVAVVVLAV